MKKLAPTLRYDLLITNRLPLRTTLEQIKAPTLLMYGAKNKYDFASVVDKIASCLSLAKIVRVEGQDHMVKPEIVLKHLRAFLN